MDTALRPVVPPLPPLPSPQRSPEDRPDAAQEFVTRLRAASPDFAMAAGAQHAVVREVVPPARHRRSRCRVVLRFDGGNEADLTFLGPAIRAAATERALDLQIQAWLRHGRGTGGAWMVSDEEAPDGVAVDLSAWAAAPRWTG